MIIANLLYYSVLVYLFLGTLFGLFFAFYGASKLDKEFRDSSFLMNLMVFPGALALWWLLLPKFFKK
ncbi:hypothetical protein [Aureibacter tunicatorum]|uniref:Uncharacterized protein n=1 Tax=Aureibacter tunicatorum TaxID=866807 RepID=A0AAE4BTA5_9BACT|nr:hypothetical protein [Aureibacter tunicatorum]MDR6239352.1 hypothetical protein [Aureibacter tunicatorum]BDD04725.1 hypothetical protein AUTU_22080 [Aureibacter tunicatorum]